MSMSDPQAQLQSRRMPAEFGERGSTRTVRHWLQLTSVVLLALLSLPVAGAVADPRRARRSAARARRPARGSGPGRELLRARRTGEHDRCDRRRERRLVSALARRPAPVRGRPPARSFLEHLLQVIEAAAIDALYELDHARVAFGFRRIVGGVLALEGAAPGHHRHAVSHGVHRDP
jgi:hypothetical protein